MSSFKIDIHTHILPREWPAMEGVELRLRPTGAEDGSMNMEWADGKFFRKVKRNCFDADKILEDCDIAGVDVQVLCTVPVMFNYHLPPARGVEWSRFLNDDLARTVAMNPRRLVGLGTLPMQDPEAAVMELRRCVNELGFKGFQIASHINAYADPDSPAPSSGGPSNGNPSIQNLQLSDARYMPLWKAAEELGVGFLVHPWDMWWCDEKYWLPWLVGMPAETTMAVCSMMLGGILEKCPGLKVMFSHSGGSFPATIGRIDWGYKTRPDLVAVDSKKSPSEYMASKAIYVDSICHDEEQLKYLVELCGADRIALGSDYPFPLGEVPSIAPLSNETITCYPGEMIEKAAYLEPKDRALIMSGTACEFLGLDPADFDRHNPLVGITREEAIKQNLAGTFDHKAATQGGGGDAAAAAGGAGKHEVEVRPHSPTAKRLRAA